MLPRLCFLTRRNEIIALLHPLHVASQCNPFQVSGVYLYAKVGCMERETFTSTKLQLHVYTDQQCSQQYKDGQSARFHATRGYEIAGRRFSSKVSFKPDFYSCLTCSPDQISQTFNKVNSNWYDDDVISSYRRSSSSSSNAATDDGGGRQLKISASEEDLKVRSQWMTETPSVPNFCRALT